MPSTETQRKELIDQLEAAFKEYLSVKKERIEQERDFLEDVLESRSGGEQELRVTNAEDAEIFATDDLNTYLGE